MDVLLVNAPLSGLAAPGGVYPSLSTLTLGSFLSSRGAAVGLFDPSVDLPEDTPPTAAGVLAACVAELQLLRPAVVGVSTMGPVEGAFGVALARRLMAADPAGPAVVLGGSWATGHAEALVAGEEALAGVAHGQAEAAMLGLHAALGGGRPGGAQVRRALAATPGWKTRTDSGEVVDTGAPQLPQGGDAATLDLGLLRHPRAYDTMVYLTSRGCPFACTFCSEPVMYCGYRHEPLPKVDADLRAMAAALSADYMWLCDPLFGASGRRLDALLPLLERLPAEFLYESRVDTLRPERVAPIRAAGGDLVYLGLEAASDRSLLHMRKVRSPAAARRYRERAEALVEACVAADVVPVLGVLNPLPGDGPADLQATLDLLDRLSAAGAAGAARSGSGLGPFFHAFPYRVDAGTVASEQLVRYEREEGTLMSAPLGSLYEDREVVAATRTLSADATAAFREQVRRRNRPTPEVFRRVRRSFPRPYVSKDWLS